ncbi:MAG TPA: hypothetical protein VFI25_11075 [Planctomycetota bacterium]|jgi:hypothetical protein|nr:hypothetical protein [Planctomycetota bacterium]
MKAAQSFFRFRPRSPEAMESLVVRVPASLTHALDALASIYETIRSEVVRELLARGVAQARKEMNPERKAAFEKTLRTLESERKPRPRKEGRR